VVYNHCLFCFYHYLFNVKIIPFIYLCYMSRFERIYGIKFPMTINNEKGLYIDIDETLLDKVESQILHVILTPKKQRIMKPDFGTNLIKYIFEPSDDITYDGIRNEVSDAINKYVSNVTLNNMEVFNDEADDHSYILKIEYSVITGNEKEDKVIAVKL